MLPSKLLEPFQINQREPELWNPVAVTSDLCKSLRTLGCSRAPRQRNTTALSSLETSVLSRSRHQPMIELIGEKIRKLHGTLLSITEEHLVSIFSLPIQFDLELFHPSALISWPQLLQTSASVCLAVWLYRNGDSP